MQGDEVPVWDATGVISQLFVYPVKSCGGLAAQRAVLTPTGLELDRAWMLVDQRGDFVTQREQPRMALIQPHWRGQQLILDAPGMPSLALTTGHTGGPVKVSIWGETVSAFDAGEAPAHWFTQFLTAGATAQSAPAGGGYRLVRFDLTFERGSSPRWTGGVRALNQFSDGFPLLVAGEASLQALNQRLKEGGHGAVGIERFRPNVVVAGFDAHDEDHFDRVRIDSQAQPVVLGLVKPCPRCPIPNIDPATALASPEVSDTMQTYRRDPRVDGAVTFGMNAIALEGIGATLQVGQRVQARFNFG